MTLRQDLASSFSSGDTMVSKLFLVLKSPSDWGGGELLGSLADDDSGIVLLNDAVLFTLNDGLMSEMTERCSTVYAMRDDLQARGMEVPKNVVDIDYHRLVELIMDDYEQTVTL